MKTTIKWISSLALVLALFSCGKTKEVEVDPSTLVEEKKLSELEMKQLGQKLFNGKGTCNACHQSDSKGVGPSVKEVVRIYDEHKASIVTFLKGEGEPIVDPKQFMVMQANFVITKKMTNQELQAIEVYMRSL
ncbi:c-type cytochrome [Myroides guanonis]|uniref:Cytochrome c n=1 Tax=Myroides guanonis TaxID=1150112 RepID=A0A1I3SGI4_9FLAO|nr:c-type cytochrome [Myroides guanonis]SFJ57884.1 cytochrome c [Myroides guanonis]